MLRLVGQDSGKRGGLRDFARARVGDGYLVGLQCCAEGLIEGNARVTVGQQRRDFRRLRGGEVPLLLNDVIRDGRAQCVLLLFGVEQLLGQNPVFDGGIIA